MEQSGFTDFLEYEKCASRPASDGANVIKAASVSSRGSQQIGTPAPGADEPAIAVHRGADRIESIEFICPCGRSAHVRVEYGEE